MTDLAQAAVLAADLSCALDPAMLMVRCGLEQDAWQVRALRSRATRQAWVCARQTGKSTVAGIAAVHTALYTPGTLTLLLSPSLRQSGELFRKALGIYRVLGQMPAEAESALRIELSNGSRIVSLPAGESNVRGFSGVALLVIDEAARVPDELYYSVRPMLATSGGRLIALGTPFGKRGWFHTEWTEGGAGWERTRVTATECSRISLAFLEEERASLGDWWYRQEYRCEFLETSDQVFPLDLVHQAITDDVEPL